MTRVNDEVVLALRCVGEFAEKTLRRFESATTDLAHQMAVRFGGEVIRRRTVTQVRVHDDAETFKLIKVAIDGGEMHVRRDALDLFGEFFRGAVRTLFEETSQQNSPRGRRSTPAFAEQIEHFFNSFGVFRHLICGP
jgi:hypothetical protein